MTTIIYKEYEIVTQKPKRVDICTTIW